MDESCDYYEILQVHPRAGQEIIKRAYRTLSRSYHPDANPPDRRAWAAGMMSQLNQAYAVLSDPETRREYDARRSAGGSASTRFGRQKDHPVASAAVRSCHWHAQRPRVSICTICGRSVCAECRRTQGMAVVCPDCKVGRRQVDLPGDVASSPRGPSAQTPPRPGVAAGFGEFFAADSLNQAAFVIMHLTVGALVLALWLRGLVLLVAFRFPGNLHLVCPLAVAATLLSVAAIVVGMAALRAFRRPVPVVIASLALSLLAIWAFYSLRSRPYAQLADAAREQGRLDDAIAGYSLALWNAGREDANLRQRLGLAYLDAFSRDLREADGHPRIVLAVGALANLAIHRSPAALESWLTEATGGAMPVVELAPNRMLALYRAGQAASASRRSDALTWTQASDVLGRAAVESETLRDARALCLGLSYLQLSRAVRGMPGEAVRRADDAYISFMQRVISGGREGNQVARGPLEIYFRSKAEGWLTADAEAEAPDEVADALRQEVEAARQELRTAKGEPSSTTPSVGAPEQRVPDSADAPANPTAPSAPSVENAAHATEPASPTAAPPAEEQSRTGTPFVGNRSSHVYHRPDCKHLPEPDNRVSIWSSEYATSQGYRPCEHCRPDRTGSAEVSAE